MATSTTTRKKKKLVYKQDSDGVFRLKKVDDCSSNNSNLSITSDDYLSKKGRVDNYLNELMDCSYTIEGDADLANLQSQIIRPRSKSSNEINSQSGNNSSEGKQTEKIPKPHSYTSKARSNSVPTTIPTNSPISSSDTSIGSTITQRSSLFPNIMAQLKQNQQQDFKLFHVPSFSLGVILTAVAAAFRDSLTRFTVGLIVCVIALGLIVLAGLVAALYMGLIKQDDVKLINSLKTYLQEIQQQSQETPLDGLKKRDDVSDIIQHYTGDDGRRKSRESLTPTFSSGEQPPETKRRMSNIRVTPYRFERGIDSSNPSTEKLNLNRQLKQNYTLANNSTPDFATGPATSDTSLKNVPALNRINTEPIQSLKNRRKSASPPYPVHTTRRPRFDSVQTASSSVKNLPSLPSDELPFINEVKLIDSMEQQQIDDEGYDYISSHPINGHFDRRSSSPTRKQSILGTTANYEKFIANVDH
ncbi:hypothetical protein CANMA_003297 [Candida margitis]|uniref:uncharacterized protein n=1 Tax=Candida margitis TaxID=1775924 RepID=UPI002226700F|nr:uncharacterized protein CANMA_003297 [Candida margitis]KAI5966051.1 hypothetical protein CANMA_003297 [Candida margitis]